MSFAGIDPSSTICGFAVVDHDRIETRIWSKTNHASGAWNLADYHDWLVDQLEEHRPVLACVEFLSVTRNANTTRKVSHFQAASVLACKAVGLIVIEARVSAARKAVLGNGGLSKDEAFERIKQMHPEHRFLPKNRGGYDEADALLLALAGPGLAER